jgi:hypothetical protein
MMIGADSLSTPAGFRGASRSGTGCGSATRLKTPKRLKTVKQQKTLKTVKTAKMLKLVRTMMARGGGAARTAMPQPGTINNLSI